MYKIYLKQAWQMLMQNRFISIIAILGTDHRRGGLQRKAADLNDPATGQ